MKGDFVPDCHHPEAAGVGPLPVRRLDLSVNVLVAHGALHLDGTMPVLHVCPITRWILLTKNTGYGGNS